MTFLKRLLVLCNPQLSCTHDYDDESDDNYYDDDDDIEEYDNNYINNNVCGVLFSLGSIAIQDKLGKNIKNDK